MFLLRHKTLDHYSVNRFFQSALGSFKEVAGRFNLPSRAAFLIGGLAYLGLWVYGLVIDHDSSINFVPVNNADNWLHFGLGLGMVLLGLTLAGQHDPTKRRARVST